MVGCPEPDSRGDGVVAGGEDDASARSYEMVSRLSQSHENEICRGFGKEVPFVDWNSCVLNLATQNLKSFHAITRDFLCNKMNVFQLQ